MVEDDGSRDAENEWLERETLGKERLGLQVKIVVRIKRRAGLARRRRGFAKRETTGRRTVIRTGAKIWATARFQRMGEV